MKKGLFLIGIVVIGVAVYLVFFNKPSQPAGETPAQQPLAQSKNGDAFNIPFNQALQHYYSLHDALVEWDTAKASASAKALQASLAKVPYDSLKADSGLILTAESSELLTPCCNKKFFRKVKMRINLGHAVKIAIIPSRYHPYI